MFCRNCGKELADNAVFCPHCGVQIGGFPVRTNPEVNETNILAIVGFVLSFFVALAGLVCSILGYRNAQNNGAPYKNLALAGIIISAVSMFIYVVIVFVVLKFAFDMMFAMGRV